MPGIPVKALETGAREIITAILHGRIFNWSSDAIVVTLFRIKRSVENFSATQACPTHLF